MKSPFVLVSAIALLGAASGGADLLGLGDYRDLCKPYGLGDPPDCV